VPIFRDIGLKLLAVALAALLWLSVSSQRLEQISVRTFDVPVALVSIPRDLIITRATPDTVSVRLRGRLSALRALSSQNLEATLSLSDTRTGDTTLPISAQSLNVPGGVEVLSIDPARLRLKLEARRQKQVRIRPYLVGELPPGYEYDPQDVTVDPANALVSGPASLVADVSEVATERVILSGRVEPFRQRVTLVSDSPLVRVVDPVMAVIHVVVRQPSSLQEAETTTVQDDPTQRSPTRSKTP